MSKVLYPDQLQDFGLVQQRSKRNSLPVAPGDRLTLEDVAYHLDEIEKKIGANNSEDKRSHDYRLRTVEEELDAITQNVVTEAGFGLTKNGNELALANPILGPVAAIGTVTSQNGHGQFTDFPSFVAGHPNLRNGITRYNCIDTTNHIEIESPDSIAENRKQYLMDLAGKIPVEETDGTLNVDSGFKVGGAQVVAQRITGWVEPTGTFDRTVGFDADAPDIGRLAIFLKALYLDLVAHGLIGE